MSKLTKVAKGRECTVNLYPYCEHNPETVVLAHAPCEDKCMSKKSPDWWGAYACYTCHMILDGQQKSDIPQEELFRCHMRGVYRTLKMIIEEGLL